MVDANMGATLHQLANLSVKVGNLSQAEMLFNQTLEEKETTSSVRALALEGIARVKLRQGDFKKAEILLQESLKLHQQVYGNDIHVNITTCYSLLA
eukprot:UN27010